MSYSSVDLKTFVFSETVNLYTLRLHILKHVKANILYSVLDFVDIKYMVGDWTLGNLKMFGD